MSPSPLLRPVEEGSTSPARGILSMQGLSHGVIRVDSEEKLSVLTLQDVGSVMPGGKVAQKTEIIPKVSEITFVISLWSVNTPFGTSSTRSNLISLVILVNCHTDLNNGNEVIGEKL